MRKHTVHALSVLVGLTAIGSVAAFVRLGARPMRLSVTTHVGDDTVVVKHMRPGRVGASVLDQYGRRLCSDAMGAISEVLCACT